LQRPTFMVLEARQHRKQWLVIPMTAKSSKTTLQKMPMSGAFSPRGRRTKLQNFQMSRRISKKLLTNASSAVREGH